MELIYDGNKKEYDELDKFLDDHKAPPWRVQKSSSGEDYKPSPEEVDIVNLSLYLRRPILVSGDPGVGKSTLAKSVAVTLDCGDVLHWQITTHSILKDGLYEYDAIARLQDVKLGKDNKNIGEYVRLGALGSAFASKSMRVVLIDEIDKSDIDFPNNLLHVLEEREFDIPELARTGVNTHEVYDDNGQKIEITLENSKLKCEVFPLIIMTSNAEREFPPAFKRRVLMHNIELPSDREELKDRLNEIIISHLSDAKKLNNTTEDIKNSLDKIINNFIDKVQKDKSKLSIDQLMNSVFLELEDIDTQSEERIKKIWHNLSE